MNALDFVIILLVSIGALHGLSRGALRMLTSAVSLIGGLYFASVYYPRAAAVVQTAFGTHGAVNAILGYLAVFVAVFAAIEIIGTSAIKLLHLVHLGWADRLLGGALGAAVVGTIIGLALMLLAAVLPPDAALLRESRLAFRLLDYDRALADYIPAEVKKAYAARRAQLARYWMESETRFGERTGSLQASPAPTQLK